MRRELGRSQMQYMDAEGIHPSGRLTPSWTFVLIGVVLPEPALSSNGLS